MIINGILVFFILNKHSDGGGFIIQLGTSSWNFKYFWILPFVIIYGVITAYLYSFFDKNIFFLTKKFNNNTKILIGAATIFIIYVINENLLFSGQNSMHLITNYVDLKSPLSISIAAILKLIFLSICLNTGWKGGDVFPLVFSGLLQGCAVALIFSNVDYLFVIISIATAFLVMISKEYFMTLGFMAMFFPLNLIVVLVIVAIVSIFVKNLLLKKFNFLKFEYKH